MTSSTRLGGTRGMRLGRWILLLGIVAAGAGAGAGWGWASPLPATRTIRLTAKQFAYAPGTIHVNRGDHVTLIVRSADVTHGLFIDGYGIRGKVYPGQELRVSFVASRRGRFTIRCSETCGVFHPFMTGKLVVAPNLVLPGSAGLAAGVGIGAVLYAGWTARRDEQ